MFTGLIEELGTIIELHKYANGLKVTISAKEVLKNIHLGDSIAINGVCVTVTSFTKDKFTADIMLETVNKTIWQFAKLYDVVHLESALTLNKPLGGHIVSGHVNGIGELINIKKEHLHTIMIIKPPKNLLKYIIPQGSIAINGVSLTVLSVDSNTFSVSLIPHTIAQTNLLNTQKINIEVDILAKYLEKLISVTNSSQHNKSSSLNMTKLLENGFI